MTGGNLREGQEGSLREWQEGKCGKDIYDQPRYAEQQDHARLPR